MDSGALVFETPQKATGDSIRQQVTIRQGIDGDLGRKIVKAVKGTKIRVQLAIQGDELRVSGKKRDDLQETIAFIKEMGIEQPLQYINFRDYDIPRKLESRWPTGHAVVRGGVDRGVGFPLSTRGEG